MQQMQEYIKKILGSGHNHPSHNNTTVIISNDEIHDIIKIIKFLEDSGSLLKGVTETVQNEVKEQKGGFLSTLLDTLGASLLGNLLTGKEAMVRSVSEETKSTSQARGIHRAGKDKGINRAGEGDSRAGYGRPSSSASQNNNSKMDF